MVDKPISDKKTITEVFFFEGHCDLNDLHVVLAQLQRDAMLLPYPGRQLAFTLSNDGFKVAKLGYKEFLKRKIEKECIEVKKANDQYKWSQQTLVIATLSLIVGLLSILISVIAMKR